MRVSFAAEVQRMEDEAIIEPLTEVRGIGRWTVEMLLMFRLDRPDVLAADDCGLRNGCARDESGKAFTTLLELLDRIDAIRLGRWIYGSLTIDEGQTCLS
jgi:hypothetical protein